MTHSSGIIQGNLLKGLFTGGGVGITLVKAAGNIQGQEASGGCWHPKARRDKGWEYYTEP